jgi:hypothetical protein
MIWRKSVQNYRFLDEDSFDLSMMEESFGLSDWIEKELTRQFKTCQGYSSLDAVYSLKDASYSYARFIIKGPHYDRLATRTKNGNKHLRILIPSATPHHIRVQELYRFHHQYQCTFTDHS